MNMTNKIKDSINKYLFNEKLGYYIALNESKPVVNRVDVIGFPLWANIPNAKQAEQIKNELFKSDMLSTFGIRSTSSLDRKYNNINEIVPYSNWQGPVWVNANAMLSYGLLKYGYKTEAMEIAKRVVQTLANDITRDGTWHEGYDSDNGEGLAADGFLSWDTLVATWETNLLNEHDPFELVYNKKKTEKYSHESNVKQQTSISPSPPPPTTTITLPSTTLQRLRDRRFGLYSYYDTITNVNNTNILINFINKYNIAFINQYSCMSYTPIQYAKFINEITNKTNSSVHILFDDTVSNFKSKCGLACKHGHSSGKGWCCGSIDLKFQCKYILYILLESRY